MKMPPSTPTERANDRKAIWVFTPSRTDPKDLEFILVQRQKLLQDAVERVRESALTDHKHHLLFVGPRGCGKTHLVTLIVSRLSKEDELADRLRIAWLNEDETCTTLLEFLFKIHAALEKRYPDIYRAELLSPAYDMKQDAALEFISKLLLSALGSHTLLVVAENLDAIFEGLGETGQKQLRSFIQENPRLSIVATAQRLVEDLSDRASPFFGFFQTEHLKPLKVEDATELLQNIARLQEKISVVEFLSTSRGRSRVRAIHHLSGGNHRIYIVLSQFITRDSVDALLEPFMKMVDELTPYYQERIRWLPPLQRKIVEYLCTCECTVPVKEIAKRLFTTSQTISSQLQDLREKGYVEAHQRGRESLYEISEPLMRICVEVKDNQRLQPLRLLVDFLRVWYDDHELQNRLGQIEPANRAWAYLKSAIQLNSTDGNLRKQILIDDFRSHLPGKFPLTILDGIMEILSTAPEALILALHSMNEGKPAEAVQCLDESITDETPHTEKVPLLLLRADLRSSLSKRAEAIADYTAVIQLPNAPVEQITRALLKRGITHSQADDASGAITNYTAVIDLPNAPAEHVATALTMRGITHGKTGDATRSIADYTAVINLPNAPAIHVVMALVMRGITYGQVDDASRAIADYTAVIDRPGTPAKHVAMALVERGITHGKKGDATRAVADYTTVINLPNAPVDKVALALLKRGNSHRQMGDTPRAIADFTTAINLPNAPAKDVAKALIKRGITYGQAGNAPCAIADFTAVIELPNAPVEQVAKALLNRGIVHGQVGNTPRAIADYTAVINLPNAPAEQVARALANRGITHQESGDAPRAVADYTAVINLSNVPVEMVARTLVMRGITNGEAGYSSLAIADYTGVIELPNAPVEQVAIALVNRGITHFQLDDTCRSMTDFTAVIDLPNAPNEQVAISLVLRGITLGHLGDASRSIADLTAVIDLPNAPVEMVAFALLWRGLFRIKKDGKRESQSDFESLIRLPQAPVEQVVDAHLALSELHFGEGRWSEGFKALESGLECGAQAQPACRKTAPNLIGLVFAAGLNAEGRRDKVKELLRIHGKHQALPVLGEAVVQHIGSVFRAGEPFPSTDNLEGWGSAWEQAAESVPDFRLSVRLLRTGIDYVKAGGDDPGILLVLTSPERAILEQALGLAGNDPVKKR